MVPTAKITKVTNPNIANNLNRVNTSPDPSGRGEGTWEPKHTERQQPESKPSRRRKLRDAMDACEVRVRDSNKSTLQRSGNHALVDKKEIDKVTSASSSKFGNVTSSEVSKASEPRSILTEERERKKIVRFCMFLYNMKWVKVSKTKGSKEKWILRRITSLEKLLGFVEKKRR